MRLLAAAAAAAATLALTGCPNPNAIGVQTYGSIKVTALDAVSNQPVANALVNAGSTITNHTGADGTCVLDQVPIGKWTVTASAAGLHGSATDVTVTENNQTPVTILMAP